MASVVVTAGALADLQDLIETRLSGDTSARTRVRRRLKQLEAFPESGVTLSGRWAPARALIGPWSWMLHVYDFDRRTAVVTVLAIVDTRTSTAPGTRPTRPVSLGALSGQIRIGEDFDDPLPEFEDY